MKSYAFLFIALPLLLISCKTEVFQEIHENAVVEGNKIPDYSGVSTLQVENYINKLHIDLTGEEPSTSELDNELALLQSNNLDMNTRKSIITGLLNSEKYFKQLFNQTSAVFLNGTIKDEIAQQIISFAYIIDQLLINGDTLSAYILEYENSLLSNLYYADRDLMNGDISRNEFYARFCLSYFFDQINMGSENFVKATFENLLGRLPTEAELSAGINIAEGIGATLLLESGNSKPDLARIVSESQEFYNHWIIVKYTALLGREPLPFELDDGFDLLAEGDFQSVLISILKSDEYAGF